MGITVGYQLFFSTFEETSIATMLQLLCTTIVSSGEGFYLRKFGNGDDKSRYNVWLHTLYPKAPLTPKEALIDPNPLFTPALSPVLSQSFDAFAHRQLEDLSFQALSNDRESGLQGLDFAIGIRWEDKAVLISTAQSDIDYAQDREGYWHMLPKILYEGIHPLYLYGPHNLGDDTLTSFADVQALIIPYLYEVNVYGPPLVAKLGRERLLATPHSIVEELADGGIYLRAVNPWAAADHLGLKTPNP